MLLQLAVRSAVSIRVKVQEFVRIFVGIIAALSFHTNVTADPLKAGTQGTEVSGLAAKVNPASIAFMPHSRFTFFPRVYERNKVNIRYPGFDTLRKEQNGVSRLQLVNPGQHRPQLERLSFIYIDEKKSKIAWAITEILPPIEVPLNIEDVPMVILDQQQIIDVVAKVNIKWALGGLVSYRVNHKLALGLSVAHREFDVDIQILESEATDTIAELRLDTSQTDVRIGMLYRHPSGGLSLGLSSIIYRSLGTESIANLSLVEQEGEGPAEESTSDSKATLLAQVLFGVGLQSDRLSVDLDLEYLRANKDEKAFSVVDFREKRRDVYDTTSVRTGMGLRLSQSVEVLAGYAYIPADVGPGSSGPDSKSGFGLIDVIKIVAGLEDLKPYQVAVAGIRRSLGPQELKRKVGKSVKAKQFESWVCAIGVGVQSASLGIDEDGEQPAAYQQTKVFIPAQASYQF